MNFSEYNKAKDNLCKQIKQLQNIAERLQMEEQAAYLNNAQQRLQDEHFNLVVVGMFSRGKSTFVDALLGKRILPTSKKPTTAVISKITYGDVPKYVLHFKDSTMPDKELAEEEFSSLTAPKTADSTDEEQVKEALRQQDELDKIAEAEIHYPLAICRNGVDLVDTPGMNDVNRTRIELTYGYLQQSDAVIMLLAADQMLSVSEVEFLRERILSRQIKDVFYVINRKDTLAGPEEEAKVRGFAENNLKEIIPPELAKDLRIFLVSSYQALLYRRQAVGEALTTKQVLKIPDDFAITGFAELEDALSYFLVHEKGQSKMELYHLQAVKQSEEIISKIDDSLHLLEHSLDEIKAKVQSLEPEFRKVSAKTEQIIRDMQMNLERYTGYIEEQCEMAGDEMLAATCAVVDNYQGELNANAIRQEINEAIAQKQKKFIDGMADYQHTIITGELTKAQKRLQEIWQNIEAQYRVGLNLPMVTAPRNINIVSTAGNTISKERVNVASYAVGASIGTLFLGAVFPAVALGALAAWSLGFFDDKEGQAKRNIKKQLTEQFPNLIQQIQKNVLSIYRSQSEELGRSINDTIEGRISTMENTLKQVMEEKQHQEAEQQKQRKLLEQNRSMVVTIRDKLAK